MALNQDLKAQIIAKYRRDDKDTGSAQVQIALLSEQIKTLTQHLKVNTKDHSSRLGLLKMVGKRKRLLAYLRKTDYTEFTSLVSDLQIRAK